MCIRDRIQNSDNSSAFRIWKQPSGGASVLVDNGVDTLFIKNGDVGIGTASPASLLHIDTGANSAANFRLGANRTVANAAVGQLIGDWDGTVVAKIAFKTGDDTTNKDDGEIAFEVAAAGTTAEAMRIQNDGKVGIGTVDPGEKLHVAGDIRVGIGGASDYNRIEFTRNNGALVGGMGWHSSGYFYVAGHPLSLIHI